VLKQMRLIHTKGFQLPERKQWKVTIFQNLLHAFQVVFGAMEEQEVDFADEGNIVCSIGTSTTIVDLEVLTLSSDSQSWSRRTPTLALTTRCLWTACMPSKACGEMKV